VGTLHPLHPCCHPGVARFGDTGCPAEPPGSCAALDTEVAGRTAGAFDGMPAGVAADTLAVDSVTVGTCLGAAVACIAAVVAANAATAGVIVGAHVHLHDLRVVAGKLEAAVDRAVHAAMTRLGFAPTRQTQTRN